MNGLPKNFDSSPLVGCTLEMVCFNATQLYLHFDHNVTVIVEATFAYQKTPSQVASVIKIPVQDSDLMELLEHSVTQATGDTRGTLTLVFDNNQTFKCFDSSKSYESYQLKIGKQVIVV